MAQRTDGAPFSGVVHSDLVCVNLCSSAVRSSSFVLFVLFLDRYNPATAARRLCSYSRLLVLILACLRLHVSFLAQIRPS
jgi:hypothetical protein